MPTYQRFVLSAALGILLLSGGCGPEAEDDADSAQSMDPAARAFLSRAQRALQSGTYQNALTLTDSAERRAPDLPQVDFIRGRIFSELKRFEAAEAAYRKALSRDSPPEKIWLNLGNNAMRQDRLREALSYYRKALEEKPSPNAYLYMGRAYSELGKIDSARHMLNRAVALDSTSARAHAYLGQTYKQAGALEKALASSRRALALAPDNLDYRYVVGSQLLQTGRTKEALPVLQTVAKERPWHHGALYNLGQALSRLGRTKEAKQYFARADSAQQRQAAIDQLRETARINPNRLMAWVRLGDALRQAGRLHEAKEAFDVALNLAPRNLALQNNAANLAHELGHPQEAIQRYRAILRQDPTLVDVWLNLGVAHAQEDRPEAARRAWRQVLTQAPDNQAAKTYLAHLKDTTNAAARQGE